MAGKKTHKKAHEARASRHEPKKKEWLNTKTKSILAIIGIIVLIFIIAYSNRMTGPGDSSIVAEVNGQKITVDELNDQYNKLVSAEYKAILPKAFFLNQTMIPELMLLQEAEKKGVKASKEEAEEFISSFMGQSGMTREELDKQLAEQNMDYGEFVEFYSKRLRIIKFINGTLGIPEVTEEEIAAFYEENKDSFTLGNQTLGLEEMREQIRSYLANDKQQQEIKDYIEKLRQDSRIIIYLENIEEDKLPGSSFTDTGSPICYEGGKPIIRMYSTTTCPHCTWIKDTFDAVAKEYMEKGMITAYHWDIDTGDNTLTDEIESSMPQGEIDILKEYNSQGGVPFYVFGCKYARIGNAYEADNDLASEKNEFISVIESLLSAGQNEDQPTS